MTSFSRVGNYAAMLPLMIILGAALPSVHAQTPAPPATAAHDASDATPYGGKHEIGAYIGHSWQAGPALGYVRNTKFTDVVVRYSYRIRSGNVWNLRYAPETTVFANLFEPAPSQINPNVPQRDLGGGVTPVGFQGVFLPQHRIQPFVDLAGGFIYYDKVVLVPGATHFMFTVDYGAGVNIFASPRNAVFLGFRYNHQSNANSAMRNPGADAEIFSIGYSHFHTKGVK